MNSIEYKIMKKGGNLISLIADPDNLRLAYYKARKSKEHKNKVVRFGKNLDSNLLQLREEILSGNVSVGKYHYFTIYDPKERRICAAEFSERVLHHAIMNVCHIFFENFQLYDSYASREGKGTYKALERASLYCKRYHWFAKLDVSKYFERIDHEVLKTQLACRFKDKKMLSIFGKIINSYQSGIEEGLSGKGVPIGNLTSQYFANHYLSFADRFAKETLKVKGYVRYMDDMLFFDTDKNELKKKVDLFSNFLEKKLHLPLKPVCLNSTDKGIPFLGYLCYPYTIRLAKRSRRRFIKKYKKYENLLEKGTWSQETYQKHILPLIAYAAKANSKGFRYKVLQDSRQWH